MGWYYLDENSDSFLSPSLLTDEGLVAVGSNLKPQTLIKAYSRGYFPWYNEGDPRCWFHPDPRFVLFPEELKISKSMHPYLNKGHFSFSIDRDFAQVMKGCRHTRRKVSGEATWITDEFEKAYNQLHEMGVAHSAEAWLGDKLAGGLYGLQIGKIFFGESMFAQVSNASKFAFIRFVQHFAAQGGCLVDCQQETEHLRSLGARNIPRSTFIGYLRSLIPDNMDI